MGVCFVVVVDVVSGFFSFLILMGPFNMLKDEYEKIQILIQFDSNSIQI